MSSPPAPNRQARRLKQAGVLALVIGLLIAGASAVPIGRVFSQAIIDDVSNPIYTAPFDELVTLDAGGYLLYESEEANEEVSPDAVRVLDPTGSPVADVRRSNGNNTVVRGSEQFVDVVQFTAPRSGRYRIDVIYPPQARLLVARDPVDAVTRAARWFTAGGIGLLVAVLGFVLLLVGFSRNRPSRRAPVLVHFGQQPWAAPPPGWYPDPQRPGGWRYWDGYRWQP